MGIYNEYLDSDVNLHLSPQDLGFDQATWEAVGTEDGESFTDKNAVLERITRRFVDLNLSYGDLEHRAHEALRHGYTVDEIKTDGTITHPAEYLVPDIHTLLFATQEQIATTVAK